MSWKSVFDVGPCTVKLYATGNTSGAPEWSGALGKGESSPIYTDPGSGRTSQIVVDANRSVSLVGTAFPPIAVVVEPNYDVSGLQTRMIAIAAMAGVQFANATNDGNPSSATGNIAVDQATGACTPDTITFSPAAGAALGLYGASS
jgi:hypothetical protein